MSIGGHDHTEQHPTIRDGRIRLSLIDIIYGIVIGFGFNFFVESVETNLNIMLFICCVLAIACDWIFIHQDYWSAPEDYGFWPFIIDLAILSCFSFMIKWAIKGPHEYVLFSVYWIFIFYAIWDFVFRNTITKRGRSWVVDCAWDAAAACGFLLLYSYSSAESLRTTLIDWPWFYLHVSKYIPKSFYENVPAWILLGVVLYAIMGPHVISEKIKRTLFYGPQPPN